MYVRATEDLPGNENKATKDMRIAAWHDKVTNTLNVKEEEHDHNTP